jgi:hypothetical protein
MPRGRIALLAVLVALTMAVGAPDSSGTAATTKRHALLVAGAFSRPSGDHYQRATDLYEPSARPHGSMVRVCANTVKKHILEANGIVTDVFQHSWNPEVCLTFFLCLFLSFFIHFFELCYFIRRPTHQCTHTICLS